MPLPILRVSYGKNELWRPTTFRALGRNEAALEELIAAAPELLGLDGVRTNVAGPYAVFHQLEVETPLGRDVAPDLVFLTQSGHVIVVEVKLADNPGLNGREVVGQVIDYAASIATYDEEELVELFDRSLPPGSRFSDVVRKHLPGCPAPVEVAEELVRKIRAAELHLVIACDRAPEGLREFVAAVTAQQALGRYELRVCELAPYVGPAGADGGVVLAPTGMMRTEVVARTVVEVSGFQDAFARVSARVTPLDEVQENVAAAARDASPMQPQIAGAVAAYARIAEPGTAVTGTNASYRFVRVPGWPSPLHYEFIHRRMRNEFGAELHFESADPNVQRAARAVRDAELRPLPPCQKLIWDPDWSDGKGRLRAVFQSDTDPEVVAQALGVLIRQTRGIVDQALKGTPPT